MAHSLPVEGIDTAGNYTRWRMACRALLLFMREHDPRVRAAWDQWLRVRQIPLWAERRWREAPVSEETASGLITAILQVDDPDDLEAFQRLVHDVIGLPYISVPQALRQSFQMWTVARLELPLPAAVWVPSLPLPAGFPIGKGPRADGSDIARNVGWLYLTRYADPRIKIKPLAKDYAETVQQRAGQRNVDARKLVRGGCEQAHLLLDLARF